MLKRQDIRIRDPFIVADAEQGMYYMYGTTDDNTWSGPGTGFDAYRSRDLEQWEGPFEAFKPEQGFWADRHFWAPEVYAYRDAYYMFASFKAEDKCRGTQVLRAESPLGPFRPLTDRPVTPLDWECLDGTLYIDENGAPWMVFCHEWLQVRDGKMCAIQLSEDLREAVSEPVVLFSASEAPWTVAGGDSKDVYVTDGPFLYSNEAGELHMIWSSGAAHGYAIGISHSASGDIRGPWVHEAEPLFAEDGGHGMLFRTLDSGEMMLAMHAPNKLPNERPVFIPMGLSGGMLSRR